MKAFLHRLLFPECEERLNGLLKANREFGDAHENLMANYDEIRVWIKGRLSYGEIGELRWNQLTYPLNDWRKARSSGTSDRR